MPSSYTPRLRLELQAAGENLNTWGAPKLNNVISRIDFAIAGRTALALGAATAYTLTSSNGDDEARAAILDITALTTPCVITIPSTPKTYTVRNGGSAAVTLTTGGGATAVVSPSEIVSVVCDGANVNRVQGTGFGGARIGGVGAPTSATDAATKAYVDATAFEMAAGSFPGQPGNAGKPLLTDGTNVYWGDLAVTVIAGAAPAATPSFTGGVTIAGGANFSGSTKANVQALGTNDFDLSAADFFTKSISTGTTFIFSNATASKAQAFAVELTITSAALPTWPPSVKWAGGVAPALGNGRHILGFITFNGGTLWTGIKSAVAAA